MHPHAELITKLYTCLDKQDHEGMASCYHPDATFRDLGFDLSGRKEIHAMWHLIADKAKLRASFTVLHADGETGAADLIDDYTFPDAGNPVRNEIRSEFRFKDGLIIEHRDSCNTWKWARQALGFVKGLLACLLPWVRRKQTMAKLRAFIADHPEYA
jgi:ketosteroid isomerase-like protein